MDTECTIGTILEHKKTGRWQITSVRFGENGGRNSGHYCVATLKPVGDNLTVYKDTEMSIGRIINNIESGVFKKIS